MHGRANMGAHIENGTPTEARTMLMKSIPVTSASHFPRGGSAMFVHHTSRHGQERPGVVLLVVIAMLALFAALGLGFVYYAQGEADAALMSTQAQAQSAIDIDPEFMLSYVLNQLIFDSDNVVQYGAQANVRSSLRGHSFGRGMYGYTDSTISKPLPATPFNGIGRPSDLTDPNLTETQDKLINFMYFPSDGFIRDPGHYPDAAGKNRVKPTDPITVAYMGE